MRELERRQKIKKRIYSIPVLLIILIVVLLTARGAWNVLEKRQESIEYVKELEIKSEELKNRQKDLEEEIIYLKTEGGIDEEIKERFNVARSGEKVVIIVDPKPTADTSVKENKPWYKRLWNAIMPGQ